MRTVFEQVIPPKRGLAVTVKKGQHLRVTDLEGKQVVDMAIFNRENPREKLSTSYSRTRYVPRPCAEYVPRDALTEGDTLMSTICRPMMTIVKETPEPKGVHDTHNRMCNRFLYESYGLGPRDGCHEIIAAAVKPYSILPEDIPDTMDLFMKYHHDCARHRWVIGEPVSKPGDYIVFRSEMDCIVGFSNRTLGRPLLLSLLVTFGISLVLLNVALRLWSADYRLLRTPYLERSFVVGSLIVPFARLVACVLGVAMVAALSWLLASTRLGRMIRATAQDLEMARMVGVNPRAVYAVTFGLGAGVSGVAGSLVAQYEPVEPNMVLTYTIFTFAVVVLGGLGYTGGVVWGGLTLGVAQALTETYLDACLSLLVAFALLYLILRFMPAGIMGKGRLA